MDLGLGVLRAFAVLIFLSLSLVSTLFWSHQRHVAEENHLKLQTGFYSSSVRYIISTINDLTDMVFYLKINEDTVLREALKRAAEGDLDRQHWIVYERYKSVYENLMRRKHVRQLHFHLPGSISFVRMHRPDKFGDSLKGIRFSIDYVNRTKKPVKCFEEGRIFNGFRNVYPILEGNRLLGTVEISYDADAIEEVLRKERELDVELWMRKEVALRKVWKEEFSNYIELPGGFLVDRATHNPLLLNENEYKGLVQDITRRLGEENGSPKAFYYNDIAVVMLPVKNCEGAFVAYLVVFVRDNSPILIAATYQRYLIGNLLVNALLVFLLYKLIVKYGHLRELSLKDALTGVLNRRAFYEFARKLLALARRENRSMSLIMCDIDYFKSFNDTYGHSMGDLVLREVARALQRNTRGGDLIARYGGEEFVILVHGDIEKAKLVAEKLRRVIEELHPQGLKITCSFGVTQYIPGENLEELINRADKALYLAKERGRNRVEVL
ncbi:diguanylate cyclase [Hydrogenivirga sp.]